MKIYRAMDVVLLLLRVAFGGAMLYGHGIGKMRRLFGNEAIEFADPFGIGPVASLAMAVFAEVICAGLLVLGLFTRWAAIPLIITMVVAAFYVHIADPFSRMEKAILYLIPYICLLVAGGGYYSLDAQLRKVKV
jgi:putative oxidoreductase